MQPVFNMSAMSKKSGDAADWYFGMSPNKVSRQTQEGQRIKLKKQKLVSLHTNTHKHSKKKTVSSNRLSPITTVCCSLFLRQINQPGLFTGGFTVSNKKNI